MKTIYVFLFVLMMAGCTQAQQSPVPFIDVTGSAEMTLIPDQVELEIILQSPSNTRQSMEETEKKFMEILDLHKVPKSALSFISADNPYYWYYWWWDYRHYYNTRTYKLKVDCAQYDFSFIKDLSPSVIRSIRIIQSTHSKITEYRRQVKVEAIKAAKEKASVLLEAIDQKAGKVIEVVEVPDQQPVNNYWGNHYGNQQNVTSNCVVSQPASSSYPDAPSNTSYMPSIKLRFEIKAKFEIL